MLPPTLLEFPMGRRLCFAAASACLLNAAAHAQAPDAGVVTALYVEHAPGVLVALSASPRHPGRIWAEIRGDRPDNSSGRLVRVPEGMRLAPGDRIPVSLAGQSSAVGSGSRSEAARVALQPCLPR
jgi:hypothetical protein